jgi:hypothetical protein
MRQAGLEEGLSIMQLLKELTRVWQLDSCYQPGWLEEGSPMMMQLPPGGGADAAVVAATAAVVSRMGTLSCSCLKISLECGS